MDENQLGPKARLTLVGTPLGNLEDMGARAVKTLTEADVLLCEDTRHVQVLLRHFDIKPKGAVVSFHDHSTPRDLEKVRSFFQQDKHVVYVSDRGMPTVSDPGFVLVRLARSLGVTVTAVPGPTAVTTFFALSGLASPKFLFHGFFPRTSGEVENVMQQIRDLNVVHIFYEAPHRMVSALEILSRNLPDFEMALGRELTKIHEEVVQGTTQKLHENFSAREKVRGECVIGVLGGGPMAQKKITRSQSQTSLQSPVAPWEPDAPLELVDFTSEQREEMVVLLRSGLSSKDVAKQLSKKFRVPRRVIYEFILKRLT